MANQNYVIAGFGGQGVLFIGKAIAYAGLIDNREVSWLPSYGPEMRGGTANCSVCLSDQPIGSPLVTEPNGMIIMNGPSFDKFIDTVAKGGKVVLDETLVPNKTDRTDIDLYHLPATQLSNDENLQGLANIILLGKFLKVTEFTSLQTMEKALEQCVPPSKAHLLEPNMRAIRLGMSL